MVEQIKAWTTKEIFSEYIELVYPEDSETGHPKIKFYNGYEVWFLKKDIKEAWDKLMDRTDNLHDLDCGDCDDDVQEFIDYCSLTPESKHNAEKSGGSQLRIKGVEAETEERKGLKSQEFDGKLKKSHRTKGSQPLPSSDSVSAENNNPNGLLTFPHTSEKNNKDKKNKKGD